MSCPNLDSIADALAGSRGGEIADHIGSCAACRAAVELMVLRAEASARAGCERAELLLALADDGGLGARDRAVLDAHLATCPACAALVEPAAPPAPPAAMALPSIDPAAYDLGPEIARGGMGRIRAAHDRRIGRPVVVKELIDKSPALAARFEREARVTARLQHPGIVPIYEISCPRSSPPPRRSRSPTAEASSIATSRRPTSSSATTARPWSSTGASPRSSTPR
ncbi:MAG: zf-HC2 domain-containing protein [Deltaproteobacteria bacterium]|nr:zf-HC2 domain-containing protein [Deltaproteobacteria bacterium]